MWRRDDSGGSVRTTASASALLQSVCGLSIAAIGGLALAGWLTGLRSLSGVRPGFIPMAPNTAIGFLVMGVVLYAPSRGGAALWRRVATAGAGLVIGLSSLRLSEYGTDLDWNVDGWFFRVPVERLGLAPVGKMAFFTASTFLVAGIAALLQSVPARSRLRPDLAGLSGLTVLAAGAVFTLGYLYSAPLLYGGRMIPMALNTASAFTLLGIGLVIAAGKEALPLRMLSGASVSARLLRPLLPFTVLVVLLSNWLTLLGSRLAAPASAAVVSALAVVVAVTVASVLCAAVAGRVGERLERAEEALRRANDELESKVLERTRELAQAKVQLEERNRQLQNSADELIKTADSVRRAHQELQNTHDDLKRAETQLIQSEKLASLGQVVAGVAHEINNPLAFVTNNVVVLQRDVGHLQDLVRLYQRAEGTLEQHQVELSSSIHELAEKMDLTYVLENVPAILARSREGLKRIQQIVKDLRDFVRLDEAEFKEVDLNEGLAATLQIVNGSAETRGIELVSDLQPLPPVACYPAKINQVILNLLSNAIEATSSGGRVVLRSRPSSDGGALLEVMDTGHGIEPAIRGKIFDPFFTTKPIGQGTGLGLSISYGIIKAHGSTIEVESEVGRGSTFTVRLPRRPAGKEARVDGSNGVPPSEARDCMLSTAAERSL